MVCSEMQRSQSRKFKVVEKIPLYGRVLIVLCFLSISLVIAVRDAQALSAMTDFSHPTNGYLMPGGGGKVTAVSGLLMSSGGAVTLPVEASDVENLGAATVTVGYDPLLLRVNDCQRNGDFDVGLCNAQFDRDGNGEPDAVRFNVVSLVGLGGGAGTVLKLVDITWGLVGNPAAGTSAVLEVEVQTFTDTEALPIEVVAENGQITITAAPTSTITPTSIPSPTRTTTPTNTPTPTPTRAATATSTPTPTDSQPNPVYMPFLARRWKPGSTRILPSFKGVFIP